MLARHVVSAALVALGVVAFPSVATADEPREAARGREAEGGVERDAETSTRWYGWQTMMADGVSILAFGVASKESAALPAYTPAAAGYALGAPVVHAVHGRWGVLAIDLGVRLAAPVGTGIALRTIQRSGCSGTSCGEEGLTLGVMSGVMAAIALDAAVFARETVVHVGRKEDVRTSPKKAISLEPSVSPRVTPSRDVDGVDVGVSGTF